jgi:hypothetical protein
MDLASGFGNWNLQKLADEAGLNIKVCRLPSGTSKWNKIEHRLFSFISQNWRGKPLSDMDLAKINIQRDKFHGDWNYCIKPRLN